jgi:hypothetical protein
MAEPDGWRELTAGNGARAVVLAIDFPATARPESGFGDLAARLVPHRAVWEATLPPPAAEADLLTWWKEGLGAQPRPVAAVLGYCIGAVFATALARDYAGRQLVPPATIVFDPEPATARGLADSFASAIGQMAAMMSPDELDARALAARQAEAVAPGLPELGAFLVEEYREVARIAFGRAGVEAALAAQLTTELVGKFAAYAAYCGAAAEAAAVPDWSAATVIRSADPVQWPTPGADERRFGVPHSGLLASDDVAGEVSALLKQADPE